MSKHSYVQLPSDVLITAHFSHCASSTPSLQLSLAGIPRLWISSTTQVSPSHLHVIASVSLHTRDILDTCFASEAFHSSRGRFHNPFLVSLSLKQSLLGSAACLLVHLLSSFILPIVPFLNCTFCIVQLDSFHYTSLHMSDY